MLTDSRLSAGAENAEAMSADQVATGASTALADGSTNAASERRRSPRAVIARGSWLAMPAAWPVQLLEVSVAGLAFSSPYALDVGRTACLRATLAGDAFNTQIRVCWSAAGSRDPSGRRQFTVGAVFLSLEESSGRALRTFLKLSPASESQHAK